MVQLVECPRDGIQGITEFISTEKKIAYLNQLIQVGFDTIDFGSFVSPNYIPQLKDTAEVLAGLNITTNSSKLLAIVANERGAEDACKYPEIKYLGYPFSISETFQLKNTGATIEQSLERVKYMQDLCVQHHKTLVIYISMGFGNPYGDVWNSEIAIEWVDRLKALGITIISMADTVGLADPSDVAYIFKHLIPENQDITIGAHLHCTPTNWEEKLAAAYDNGCRRFDSALLGYGGCPLSGNALVGNMNTQNMMQFLKEKGEKSLIEPQILDRLAIEFQHMIAH